MKLLRRHVLSREIRQLLAALCVDLILPSAEPK